MSEPRCECERVRRELRMKPRDAAVVCCPLHPQPTDEMLQPTKPDQTGVLLKADLAEGTISLHFSKPSKLISLTPDQARELAAGMVKAAEMVDFAHSATPEVSH